ncbi:DUF262 domain-containing protein [Crocosphaera sp. XPORK-15E]|uniref:DUF262 domain-containing protein n=1 Tax=Crocosphaera sp. XPORK-15E TaxID=3110247 RepID=UPI002B1EE761|nr:DUF262 domain-containing protein [Crocosphaera sp. XPORK-15E]MEA5532895.1 DUF262 domain-containing protein [Crocosphaera sp. XPORK-15E]
MGTIEYKKSFFKVADFVSWQKDQALILSPKFQRRSVWKSGTKSFLIDTIVRGLPIPIIFLRDLPIDLDTLRPKREVIDGQQRLRTVLSFVAPQSLPDYDPEKDQFTVQKNHNKEIAGKTFQELDDEIKRDILDYEFSVHILSPRMDDREVIDIFRRMNSTYYQLNKQELRNAEYFGEFKTLAYQLAVECLNYWKNWKIFNDDDIARMKEVKLTSELIIMMIEGKLLTGENEDIIDGFYQKYDDTLPNKSKIYDNFHNTMKVIDDYFKDFLPSSKFHEKTKIYIFFAVIYDLLFGINSMKSRVSHPINKLSSEVLEKIKIGSDYLTNKPIINAEIEKALTSRRKGVTERETIFNYLRSFISNPTEIYAKESR